MNCSIAICDDSAADRDFLAGLVRRWAGDRGHTVQLALYPSAESFLFHYAEDKSVQILLLDVEMGQMDGVTMARALRRDNDAVQIVFITGYSDYIADGYEVEALHYPDEAGGRGQAGRGAGPGGGQAAQKTSAR